MFKIGDLSNIFKGINDKFDNYDSSGGTFSRLINLKPNKKISSLKSRGPFIDSGIPTPAVKNGLVPGLEIHSVKEAFQFRVTKPSEKLITEIAAVCKFYSGSAYYYMLRFFRYPSWFRRGYAKSGSAKYFTCTEFSIGTTHTIEIGFICLAAPSGTIEFFSQRYGYTWEYVGLTSTQFYYILNANSGVTKSHGGLTVGNYYHLIITRSAASVKFYLNGTYLGESTLDGGVSGNNMYISQLMGRSLTFYQGLEFFRVYSLVLDASQVTSQCSEASNPFKAPYDIGSLLCRYEFDESGKHELLEMDQSGNARNLTSTGITYTKNMQWVNGWQEKKVWYIDFVQKSIAIDAIGLAAEPTEHVSGLTATNPTDVGFDIEWIAGGGATLATYYTVLRTVYPATPDSPPNDSEVYTAGTFIGNATVVYVNTAVSFTDTSAAHNTHYIYTVYPSNGNGSDRNYKKTLPVTSVDNTTLSQEPLAQPAQVGSPSYDGTYLIITVTPNSMTDRFIVLERHDGTYPTIAPSDGVDYAVGYTFGDGATVVFNGTGETSGSNKLIKMAFPPLVTERTYKFEIYAFRED